MLSNLLLPGMQPWQTGLFTFLLGLLVTFLGMAILVLCVSGIGKLLSIKDEKKAKTPVTLPDLSEERPVVISDDDVPEEVKVATIAAISAYYDSQPVQNNEFVVRKIKRLR